MTTLGAVLHCGGIVFVSRCWKGQEVEWCGFYCINNGEYRWHGAAGLGGEHVMMAAHRSVVLIGIVVVSTAALARSMY